MKISIFILILLQDSLLVNVNVDPRPRIISTLKTEATCSFETQVLTRPTRRHIPEDCCEILKSYIEDIMPRDSCKNRRFGGTYLPHHQGEKKERARNDDGSNYHLEHPAKKH
jgi:hypothetical protein